MSVKLNQLADLIVDDLFTNGFGEEAQRLVLELKDKRDGGGWCKDAVRDRILDILASIDLNATDLNTYGRFSFTPFSLKLNNPNV